MRFSKIDKELSVYKGKTVVIWGASYGGYTAYEILRRNNIPVESFVDNNPRKTGRKFLKTRILSPEQLEEMYHNTKNVLVQIGSSSEHEIEQQLLEMGIHDYVSFSEISMIPNLEKYLLFSEKPDLYSYYVNEVYEPYMITNLIWEQYLNKVKQAKNCIIFCMPQKTGNHTVFDTAERYVTKDTMLLESWHTSRHLKELMKITDLPIKMVTAVREPISQNLSEIYHVVYGKFWDHSEFWDNDVNGLFHKFFVDYEKNKNIEDCFWTKSNEKNQYPVAIQNFFEKQFEEGLGIHLFDYPFDKENGYSVIHENGVEIFVYQIEKLNNIYKELLRFMGIDADVPLLSNNCAVDKFYNPYYREAKKELRFSKEYYDWSFSAPYLRHFYSDKEIENFKAKWSDHIQ